MITLNVIGMDDTGDAIAVCSVEPKEKFQRGGEYYGRRYQYEINHFSWQENKARWLCITGITEEEYNRLDGLYQKRFSFTEDEWYDTAEDNEMTTRNAQRKDNSES